LIAGGLLAGGIRRDILLRAGRIAALIPPGGGRPTSHTSIRVIGW